MQTYKDKKIDRTDHVWGKRKDGTWICLLCGGTTPTTPPDYPTPKHWSPAEYEKLSDAERALVPYKGKTVGALES